MKTYTAEEIRELLCNQPMADRGDGVKGKHVVLGEGFEIYEFKKYVQKGGSCIRLIWHREFNVYRWTEKHWEFKKFTKLKEVAEYATLYADEASMRYRIDNREDD